MVDFEFTEEQKMIQRVAKEFGTNEIAPYLKQMDEEMRIPDHIIKALAKVGYLGLTVSEEYGGVSADPVTVGIIAEQLARADIGCAVPTMYLVEAAWSYLLDRYGEDEAKEAILPKVTTGEAFLGIGATEPDVGSDLGNMRTVGKRQGDKYVINGEKMFISGIREVMTQFPLGGGYMTLVKTHPSKGTRGLSLFFIPVKNYKGVATTFFEDWGRRGLSTGGFAMSDVEVPVGYRIGKEDKGFYISMRGFDYARAIISIVCCGSAMSSLEQAMEYLKIRDAFGFSIAKFEGVQFKLAENWGKLEAVRMLGYRALWMLGKEQSKRGHNRFEVTKACAMAKMLAPSTAFEAINDALQWFGAYGYTADCQLELALKAVRSYYWAEGTLEIMKVIVARELLGKEYVAYR